MIQHEVSVHLDQPVEQVFSFLVDTSKLVSWQSNLIKSELLTEGPLHLGSQFREVRRLGQRESEIRGEIIAFEQGRYFETQTSTKPEVHVSYWLQPEDGGTRLRHRFIMHTQGIMRLLEPMIANSIKKEAKSDLAALKHILEK